MKYFSKAVENITNQNKTLFIEYSISVNFSVLLVCCVHVRKCVNNEIRTGDDYRVICLRQLPIDDINEAYHISRMRASQNGLRFTLIK